MKRRLLVAAVLVALFAAVAALAGSIGSSGAARAAYPAPRPTVTDFQFIKATTPTEADCEAVGRTCFTPQAIQSAYNLGPLYQQGKNGKGVTIAIVDDGGHLLWLQRLDGAAPISAHIAPGKARTAALGRRVGHDWLDLGPWHGRGIGGGRGHHVRLARHQLKGDIAREAERGLQLPEPRRHRARPIEVHGEGTGPLGIFGPPSLHRHVPAIELAAQTLPQLALEPA